MLRKRNNVVVGLTTYHTEMLAISVPALARLKDRFTLIIHNDNPDKTVSASDIRAMGYGGKLHIINSKTNVGLRTARLNIIDTAKQVASSAKWIIFTNDDDILTSVDVATAPENNFAIIHSSIFVKHLYDLVRTQKNLNNVICNNKDIIINRPSLGLCGAAVRTDIMQKFADVLRTISDRLDEIDSSLSYMPPTDMMMWMALNMYARAQNPDAAPIFMDTINYIHNEIDRDVVKYNRPARPTTHAATQIAHAMKRYETAIAHALSVACAAPGGLE